MNLLDLMIKVGVDDKATAGLKKIAGTASKTLTTAFKVGAAAVGAASAAAVAFTKQAIEAYGTYEQLIGGTKLLYGDAWEYIQDKAKNAYKDVQMSQNDYLQQVNGFAVGLKKSLNGDEQAAAVLADRIVTAEADVVAATGASSEAVQNAFNGIMKGNYTMLDNLQLGITPTKAGMESLIKEVNKWNKAQGKSTKYSIKNTADIMNALVDYVEMQGLAGYAQMEGAETIQGSLAKVKAAWDNLLVGLVDDEADISELFGNLADSGKGFIEKIKPRIKQAASGIGTVIREGLPEVLSIAGEMLPDILQLGIDIVGEIGSAITEALPNLVGKGLEIINKLASDIASSVSNINSTGLAVITLIADSITDNLPQLLNSASEIISELAIGFAENAPNIIGAGLAILTSIIDGLTNNSDKLITAAFDIVMGLVKGLIENIPAILGMGVSIVTLIITGIGSVLKNLVNAGVDLLDSINEGFNVDDFVNAGKQLVDNIKAGIDENWDTFVGWISEKWNKVKEMFGIEGAGVAVSHSPMNGGFSSSGGLSYVPHDNWKANLHKGERVLTKTEADEYNRGGRSNGATVNVYAQTIDKNTMDYIMNNVNLLGGMA